MVIRVNRDIRVCVSGVETQRREPKWASAQRGREVKWLSVGVLGFRLLGSGCRLGFSFGGFGVFGLEHCQTEFAYTLR